MSSRWTRFHVWWKSKGAVCLSSQHEQRQVGSRVNATIDLELTRRANVQHVTSWLVREESDIRYTETSNIRPLLSSDRQQNETTEFISVSNFIMVDVFGVSVEWNHPMFNFYSSVVCTRKRRKPRINMNYYTTNPLDSNHNVLLTYVLTPWSRVLFGKLTGFSASQEIPHIYGTRKFITVLTSARHLSLSWARSIQSPQPPPTSW
jgi:hypothetical protein